MAPKTKNRLYLTIQVCLCVLILFAFLHRKDLTLTKIFRVYRVHTSYRTFCRSFQSSKFMIFGKCKKFENPLRFAYFLLFWQKPEHQPSQKLLFRDFQMRYRDGWHRFEKIFSWSKRWQWFKSMCTHQAHSPKRLKKTNKSKFSQKYAR